MSHYDQYIEELQHDSDNNPYRMMLGKKVYQVEEVTDNDIQLNLNVNRERCKLILEGVIK